MLVIGMMTRIMRNFYLIHRWLFVALSLFSGKIAIASDAAMVNENASSAQKSPFADEFSPASVMGPGKVDDFSRFDPASEIRQGHEGWVEINAMISPEGRAYEPVVVDSSGNVAFEKAALGWAAAHKFKAATLNGSPIDSGYSFKVIFAQGQNGASKGFIARYKELIALAQSGDKSSTEAALQKLAPQNLYEDAFMGIAQYAYFGRWGTVAQQMEALHRAIANEHQAKYLSDALFQSASMSLFNLQIQSGYFGSAMQTYEDLSQQQKSAPDVQANIVGLRTLQTNDTAFTVRGAIEEKYTRWNYRLLKQHFSVVVTSGELTEIKLRCDKKFVLIPYSTDFEYTIPNSFGSCDMEMIGSGGTEFALIQS